MKILYCVGQLGFLSLCRKYRFRPSRLINYVANLMILPHICCLFYETFTNIHLRTFVFNFHWNVLHLSKITWNTHTSKRTLHTVCYFLSSIGCLNLHLSTYMNLLCIKYKQCSVVIAVKLFANVLRYNPVSISRGEDLPETSSDTATTIEEFDSSVMLSRQTLNFCPLK